MFIFEHAILFSIIGLIIVVTAFLRWTLTREPGHRGQAIVTATCVLVFLAVNWTVVSAREQIAALCREFGRHVDSGDVTALGSYLSRSFVAEGLTREQFLDRATTLLTSTRVDSVRLKNMNIELEGDAKAVALFSVSCTIRTADGIAAPLPTRWRLWFGKSNDRWLVTGIESVPVPPYNFRSFPTP